MYWILSNINRERYSCSAKREKGTCNNPVGIKAVDLETRVIDGLKNILIGREDLLQEFASAFHDEIVRLRRERNSDRRSKEKELAKVQRSIDRCLSFIIDGDGPMDAVREKLRQLELTKSTIEKSMEQELTPDNIEMHPNIGQLYQRKVSEINHLLSDQASREEAISLIRSLIERIDILPGEKRGKPQVQLVGGLAAILEFAVAKQQKTAIPSDSGFGRVFMVAGARNRRYLHLDYAMI